jgi:hypothetical protein
MTLSQRNRLNIIGISVSILFFLALLVSVGAIFSFSSDAVLEAHQQTIGLLQPFIHLLFEVHPYSVFASIILSSMYALAASILIYFYFEKTQCQEILFFTFFALSFCFEIFRFIIPLSEGMQLPRVYIIAAGRIVLFGRFFGVLSLFVSSIYAAGFQVQKQSHIIFMIIIISMIIASGIPIDALSWDSALNITHGYSVMLLLVETGIFFLAIISFFIAVSSRGSKEFIYIGIGSILLFFGRNFLLNCDTWVILPIAASLLGTGMWYVCSRLHQIYLWL